MLSPVFILGCPRSGTTLLSKLLEPTAYGAPVETHFIIKYFKKLPAYGDITESANFRRLMKDILSERPVMQWKMDVDIEKFRAELKSFEYPEIVNKLCSIPFQAKGKKSWGDKTPRYILDSDIIFQLFPDSKYLCIVRDGRDVTLSLLRKLWGPNNVYSCAAYWKQCNKLSAEHQAMQEQGKLFALKYETLLEHPEKTVKEIYSFLDEPYDKEKLGSAMASINRANFNKWKTAMSPGDIKIFETVASDTLNRFGYETSFPQGEMGNLTKSFWRAHDFALRFKHLVKMNTIDAIRIKYFGMQPFAD
jgi:hypothetical protein